MSGIMEILLVLAIVVVVFGASRIPAIGGAVGKMVRNFKNATATRDEIQVSPPREKLDPPDADPRG